jgi:hypothetical protein
VCISVRISCRKISRLGVPLGEAEDKGREGLSQPEAEGVE